MAERIELAKAYVQVIPTTEGIKDNLTSSFTAQGEESGTKFTSGMKSVITASAKGIAIASAAVATAATAAIAGVVKGAKEVAEYGDNIDKMSQKMGISAQAYQEWEAVMQHSGTSMESLRASMKTMSVQAEKNAAAFAQLGISEEQVANMSQEDLFNAVITGLQGMEEGTERTALASQLLGRGATELGALLNTSAEDTQAMKDRVHELGGVMSDEAVKASAAFQDQLQDMNTSIDGIKRNIMSELLPGLTSVMAGVTDIFSGDKTKGLEEVKNGVNDIISSITEKLPDMTDTAIGILDALSQALIDNLPTILEGVVDLIIKIGEKLPDFVDDIVNVAVQLVNIVVENIPTLIDTLVNGLLSAETISSIVSGLIQVVVAVIGHLPEIIASLIDAIPTIIENVITALIDNLPMLIEGCIQLVTQLVVHLPEIIGALILAMPRIIIAIVNALKDLPAKLQEVSTEAFTKMIDAFKELPAKLKEKFIEAKEKWSEAWSNIKELVSNVIKKIKEPFDKFVKTIKDIGKNIVKGLWNGISDKTKWLKDKIGGWVSGIGDKIKGFFGINSPSRLMAEYGRYIDEGLALGIEKNANLPEKAMLDMADDMTDINIPTTVSSSAMLTASAPTQSAYTGRLDTIEKLLKQIATEGKELYLDGTTLVGGTAKKMNAALDKIDYSRKRGVTNYAY